MSLRGYLQTFAKEKSVVLSCFTQFVILLQFELIVMATRHCYMQHWCCSGALEFGEEIFRCYETRNKRAALYIRGMVCLLYLL